MRIVDREQQRTPGGRGAEQTEGRGADRKTGVPGPVAPGGQEVAEQIALGCRELRHRAAVRLDDLVQARIGQSRFGGSAREVHRSEGGVEGEEAAEQGGPSQPWLSYDEQRTATP